MTELRNNPPGWQDVHAHPADPRFSEGANAVIERAQCEGVTWLLANAVVAADWDSLIGLAEHHRGVYCALGIHPWQVASWTPDTKERLAELLGGDLRIAAVGEIGLDFYHGRENIDQQVACFSQQLHLARRFNLPVILHNRKSWNQCFQLLKNEGLPQAGGVCHGFSGSRETAREALDLGLHLSFGGMVTYPHNTRCRDAAAFAPSDRLLTESDAPDLPSASSKGALSRPQDVAAICTSIAEIRNIPATKLAETVAENVATLFPDCPPADVPLA